MESKKTTIGWFIIASAIVWAGVILGCSFKLQGTDCYSEISVYLTLGASLHLLLVMAPLALQIRKLQNTSDE